MFEVPSLVNLELLFFCFERIMYLQLMGGSMGNVNSPLMNTDIVLQKNEYLLRIYNPNY
jgi:hypothetical protein